MDTIMAHCVYIFSFTLWVSCASITGEVVCDFNTDAEYECMLVETTPATRADAEEVCAKLNGQLVSGDSPAMHSRLTDSMKKTDIQELWVAPRLEPTLPPQPWRWIHDDLKFVQGTLPQNCSRECPLLQQGCYSGYLESRELLQGAVTPQSCMDACFSPEDDSVTYAGTTKAENGDDHCYCGRAYVAGGRAEMCTATCAAGTGVCGGLRKTSLYYKHGLPGEWGFGQPNNVGGSQFCGAIDITHQSQFILGDEECRKHYRFMCELDVDMCGSLVTSNLAIKNAIDAICERNSTLLGYATTLDGRCYFLSKSLNRLGWYQSREECRRLNGTLFTLNNMSQQAAVRQWLNDIHSRESVCGNSWSENLRQIWVGLVRRLFEHQVIGSSPGAHTYFAADEPNSAQGDCVVMSKGANFTWTAKDCALTAAYACLYSPEYSTEATTDITTDSTTDSTSDSTTHISVDTTVKIPTVSTTYIVPTSGKKTTRLDSTTDSTTRSTTDIRVDTRPTAKIPTASTTYTVRGSGKNTALDLIFLYIAMADPRFIQRESRTSKGHIHQ